MSCKIFFFSNKIEFLNENEPIDFVAAMDDNNMQMVQMSKTLSTKSIRDELCTNAGAD